jgi:hypothetical protein
MNPIKYLFKKSEMCVMLLIFVLSLGFLMGCTQNQRAKQWGGNAVIKLDSGQKLLNVTWKDAQIWVLTKPMTTNDVSETYTFKEFSNFGVIEGTVTIMEKK